MTDVLKLEDFSRKIG